MRVCICTMVKNEQRFVKEWVDYHLGLGVSKIYIYEDFGSDTHYNELYEEIENGTVVLTPVGESILEIEDIPYCGTQSLLFNKFMEYIHENDLFDWAFLIDVDEFVTFGDGWNLDRLTEEYKDSTSLLLNWLTMTANGHIKRPEGNVVDNYTVSTDVQPDKHSNWIFKSFINVKKYNGLISIHEAVDATLTNGEYYLGNNPCYDVAWIRHYYTKSWEDYCDRMFERGNMGNNSRDFDVFFAINPEMRSIRKKLFEQIRYRHCKDTMWISKEFLLISGGNEAKIKNLREHWFDTVNIESESPKENEFTPESGVTEIEIKNEFSDNPENVVADGETEFVSDNNAE